MRITLGFTGLQLQDKITLIALFYRYPKGTILLPAQFSTGKSKSLSLKLEGNTVLSFPQIIKALPLGNLLHGLCSILPETKHFKVPILKRTIAL